MELAINSNFIDKKNELEALRLIKDAGIKNVFLWWNNGEDEYNLQKFKFCKENGLNVIFAHLAYLDTNDLWLEGEAGERFVENYHHQFKLLSQCGIKMAVMHAERTKNPPPLSEIGLKRFARLVDLAGEYDIVLAVENTWYSSYLNYVFTIQSPYLKACYDFGHDHCLSHDAYFDEVNRQIVAIHAHDNLGDTGAVNPSGEPYIDLHLLPFEGNIDFADKLKRLKNSGYNGPLTLEMKMQEYKNFPPEQFLALAKERGEKLIEMFDAI